MDKEYAGITGVVDFTTASAKLALGENNPVISEGAVRITSDHYFKNYLILTLFRS